MDNFFNFRLDSKQDVMKYGEVIVDFVYFKTSDEFEKKIEKFQVILRFTKSIEFFENFKAFFCVASSSS